MITLRRFAVFSFFLALCVGFAPRSVSANGAPLPALPPQSVINSVLSQTNGAGFTPLYAPNVAINTLSTFGGVFAGAHTQLDTAQAVNYFTSGGSRLRETVIPMLNSGTLALDPNITAPGTDPRPGRIIGALFQPLRGQGSNTLFLVAAFPPGANNSTPPEKIRFYYNATQYHEQSLYWGQFLDPNGDGLLEMVDHGAIIAHKYTCVTIGFEQVCWDPFDYGKTRDGDNPKNTMVNAHAAFKNVYDIGVDFYEDDAVPDLLGHTSRTSCSAQLVNATNFNANMTNCIPNAVFSAAKEVIPGRPIALMVITRPVDVRTYDMNGNFIGQLPRGRYLVMDATPSATTPGQPALLFLVNINRTNHYLIPSVVVQGFSQSTAINDDNFVALKDGLAWWRGFGW